jgi:hypothetical protein
MQTWVIEYDGVPPAEVFSTTAGFGTPIVIDKTTGFAYFYKTGAGVTLIDSPAGGGISDHGALTGLLDDDHPQYLTEARGDLLYQPLGSPTDSWTYIWLSSDVTVSSTTPVSVFSFAPSASTKYIVEGQLIVETSSSSNGPCPGISWPSGLSSGVAKLTAPKGATSEAVFLGNSSASGRAVGTGASASTPYPASVNSTFTTGGSPSGNFVINISSET